MLFAFASAICLEIFLLLTLSFTHNNNLCVVCKARVILSAFY